VTELGGPYWRKAGAAAFLKAVAACLGRRLAKAEAVIEQCAPDVAALRMRVTINRAVDRARRVVQDEAAATKITRYEGHLQRQLTAMLTDLNRLQGRREKAPTPD
jgi:hypothetical protein